MAKSNITVMECDRCGTRLVLDNKGEGYSDKVTEAAQWASLHHYHMGGETTYLFCVTCWTEFRNQFLDNIAFRGQ